MLTKQEQNKFQEKLKNVIQELNESSDESTMSDLIGVLEVVKYECLRSAYDARIENLKMTLPNK